MRACWPSSNNTLLTTAEPCAHPASSICSSSCAQVPQHRPCQGPPTLLFFDCSSSAARLVPVPNVPSPELVPFVRFFWLRLIMTIRTDFGTRRRRTNESARWWLVTSYWSLPFAVYIWAFSCIHPSRMRVSFHAVHLRSAAGGCAGAVRRAGSIGLHDARALKQMKLLDRMLSDCSERLARLGAPHPVMPSQVHAQPAGTPAPRCRTGSAVPNHQLQSPLNKCI